MRKEGKTPSQNPVPNLFLPLSSTRVTLSLTKPPQRSPQHTVLCQSGLLCDTEALPAVLGHCTGTLLSSALLFSRSQQLRSLVKGGLQSPQVCKQNKWDDFT